MAVFQSKLVQLSTDNVSVYNYLSDFRNFGTVMPEQIKDWQATESSCSFSIPNLATIHMSIKEKIVGEKISIVPDGSFAFPFELTCNFTAVSDSASTAMVVFDANINPMMSMMVSKPLQNFVDLLAEQIQRKFS